MKKVTLIKIIYFIKFFADALFCGYMSMYFATFFDKFSFEYGCLLGVIPFCALIGNYLWGLFYKNVKRNLLLIKLILAFEWIGLMLFSFIGTSFPILLTFTIFVSLFNSPYFSLQDTISSSYSRKEEASYVGIRACGSIGYFFALIIGAGLLKLFSEQYRWIFLIAGILYIIAFIMWFFIPPFEESSSQVVEKVSYREVLKNKSFIAYYIAYVFLIGCNNVGDSYLFARLTERGISSSIYSLIFAAEVFLEITTMLIIAKFINEKKSVIVLKVSIIFLFLRAFLLGFNFPLGALIPFCLFRGIGWGGFLGAHINTLKKIIPQRLMGKAISLLAVALSLFNGIFTLCGTIIYQKITLYGFYFLLSGGIFIGIMIIYFMHFPKENEVGGPNVNKDI